MAYATAAQWFERFDVRIIQQLVNDDNVTENRIDLLTNVNVVAILDAASGEMDAALLTASRYSETDLSGLTGTALAHRIRICTQIAMALAFDRRPGFEPELAEKHHEKAQAHLEKLRTGQNIFNLPEHQTASNPTLDGPSSVDYARNNMLVDRSHRYFSGRSQRLPTDRN